MEQIVKLHGMEACQEALDWLETQLDWDTAWQKCGQGDWMLWLLGKLSGKPVSDGRRKLVLAACECARLALPYVPKGEVRPLRAIETAEAWARGQADVTLSDVQAAAAAAYAAYAASTAASSAYATYAAYAAYAAVSAATEAAVTYAAVSAAASAAYATAPDYKSTLAACADIVRAHYPEAPKL